MPPAPAPPETPEGVILALLAWQAEFGVQEAVGEAPVNRYADAAAAAPAPASAAAPPRAPAPPLVPAPAPAAPGPLTPDAARPATGGAEALAAARRLAAAAADLSALRAALAGFDGLALRRGARNLVFADGLPGARVMIVGEAPGREEDLEGLPFVGRAGRLLDRMFAAIGLSRRAAEPARALYITNVLPWRPPENRTPTPEEITIMQPFLERHVQLAAPDVLVVMGNTPAQALLGRKGILSLRGSWTEALGRPVLPMAHPAYLLRNPLAKREAWADLLSLQAWLREHPR